MSEPEQVVVALVESSMVGQAAVAAWAEQMILAGYEVDVHKTELEDAMGVKVKGIRGVAF